MLSVGFNIISDISSVKQKSQWFGLPFYSTFPVLQFTDRCISGDFTVQSWDEVI